MPYLETDQGQLYYQVQGKGQPIVILRGLARSSRYWLGFENHLAKFYQVIMLDHRGIGRTTIPMSWNDSIENLAEDLKRILDHLELEKAHIFGLSLGGMIAMAFARVYPERCQTLMVANSSSADSFPLRVNPMTVASIGYKLLSGHFHTGIQEGVTTPQIHEEIGHKIKEEWDAIRSDEGFPLETLVKQLLAAGRFRISKTLDGKKLRTLILYGNQDRFVPKVNSMRLHQLIPGSKLRALCGVGHEISLGKPDLLVNTIREFAV